MLAASVKGLKTGNPMARRLTLAGLSFLYGILHAVGPGHGKTIISSYVVANEETVRRGIIISFIAAGLQALTAVAAGRRAADRAQRDRASGQCLVQPARKRELRDDRAGRPLSACRRSSCVFGGSLASGSRTSLLTSRHRPGDHGHHDHRPRSCHDHATITTIIISHHARRRGLRSHRRCAAARRSVLLAQGHGGGVLGRHQAVHRRDPRARVCADARPVLGGRRGDLRHGARHRHYRRRAGDACARLARACAQARRRNAAWANAVWTTCTIGGALVIFLFGLLLFLASLGPARPF